MMKLGVRLLVLLSVLSAPVSAGAEGVSYTIDPDFVRIGFSVDNLGGLFSTTGQFTDFKGNLMLDADNLANSQVDVSARTQSVSTGWAAADAMLNSPDYLDPARFPEIRFVSRRIDLRAPDHAVLHGLLTMRGVTRDQAFDAVLQGRRTDPVLGPVADYVVEGKVKRDDYGMTADHPLVGEDITVRIAAHIRLIAVP